MNLEVGKQYWTIEPLHGSDSPVREPWLGTWVKKIEYSDEVFRLHDPSCELKGRYSHSRPNPTLVYTTELEAKQEYISAKLREAYDLQEKSKKMVLDVMAYAKACDQP